MKIIYITILSVFISLSSSAQDVPFTSDVIQNPFLQNPARAGNNDFFRNNPVGNIFLSYRSSWLGTEEPTSNQIASIDSPIKFKKDVPNIGVGITIHNERAHILSRTGLSMAYAYHLYMGSGKYDNKLSFGVNFSYLNQRVNLNGSDIFHSGDPSLAENNWTGNFINAGFGMTYRSEVGFSVDFSMSNLLNILHNKKDKTPFYSDDVGFHPSYQIAVRHKVMFKESKKFGIEPFAIFYGTQNLSWSSNIGLTANLGFNNFDMWITTSTQMQIKNDNDVDGLPLSFNSALGFSPLDKFSISFFYDNSISYFDQTGYSLGMRAGYYFGKPTFSKKSEKTKEKRKKKKETEILDNSN